MGLDIDFYQLVRPHVCDTIAVIGTESMWQVKTDMRYDSGDVVEYYTDNSWFADPPTTANDNRKKVDVDQYSCDHVNHYLTDATTDINDGNDSDDDKDRRIVVKRYGDAKAYIYTSPTFELGKLYELKKVGESNMSNSDHPRTHFPTSNVTGLYTGPILEHIVERLIAAYLDDEDLIVDATTMFAEYGYLLWCNYYY